MQASEAFEFPVRPAEPPDEEYAVPPTIPQAEFGVAPARPPRMPAYQRGPSYVQEVGNLTEPEVLREDTVLVSPFPIHMHCITMRVQGSNEL